MEEVEEGLTFPCDEQVRDSHTRRDGRIGVERGRASSWATSELKEAVRRCDSELATKKSCQLDSRRGGGKVVENNREKVERSAGHSRNTLRGTKRTLPDRVKVRRDIVPDRRVNSRRKVSR